LRLDIKQEIDRIIGSIKIKRIPSTNLLSPDIKDRNILTPLFFLFLKQMLWLIQKKLSLFFNTTSHFKAVFVFLLLFFVFVCLSFWKPQINQAHSGFLTIFHLILIFLLLFWWKQELLVEFQWREIYC